MKNTIIERLKSPVVWVAVIAEIVFIIGVFNPDVADSTKVVLGSILKIVELFGLLNDPTNRGGF